MSRGAGANPTLGLVFLTGLHLLNYIDRYVLASVVPPIKAEFHLNDTEIGWLTSAFMIGYFATSPFFGYLGDRSRRKYLLLSGVVMWSLGTILSGFCHSYGALIGCRLLVGLGEASYVTVAPAWLSDLYPVERRNNALTIFYMAIPLGAAIGYLIGGLAVVHGGWRYGFIWAGVPGLLFSLLLLPLTEPRRGASDTGGPEGAASLSATKPGIATFARLFQITDFNLIVFGYTAYTFALGGFAAWGPTFLNRVHGLELAQADRFFGSLLVITGLFGTFIGGFAATALRRKIPSAYALMVFLATALAIPLAIVAFLDVDISVSMACLGVAMFLAFLPTGPISLLILQSVPAAFRASAMAASTFAIHLFGDFWSPVVIGKLADWGDRPDRPTIGLHHAMFIVPAVLSLAALSWGWLAWRQRAETVPVAG